MVDSGVKTHDNLLPEQKEMDTARLTDCIIFQLSASILSLIAGCFQCFFTFTLQKSSTAHTMDSPQWSHLNILLIYNYRRMCTIFRGNTD